MLVDLIKAVVVRPAFFTHSCARRYVQGLQWSVPRLPQIDLAALNYTSVKLTNLKRNYYNEDEITKAKVKLEERQGEDLTSVGIMMRNEAKSNSRSQGWCIQNLVISVLSQPRARTVTADVFYRATEVILKFHADLVLLQQVFDALGVNPSPVRFHFSNAYLDVEFFPTLFQFTDPVEFFEHLRKHDPVYHRLAAKIYSGLINQAGRSSYRKRAKQQAIAEKMDRTTIDRYLTQHLGGYHRACPGERTTTARFVKDPLTGTFHRA